MTKKLNFYHLSGKQELGITAEEFMTKYKVAPSLFNRVLQNSSKSVFGWYVDKSVLDDKLRIGVRKQTPAKKTETFNFYHVSGKKELNITFTDFITKYDLYYPNVYAVIKGKSKTVKGWSLVKELKTNNLFNFYHTSGKSELKISVDDFIKKYNLHSSNVYKLVNNQRKSTLGWYIDKSLINTKLFDFYHESGKSELKISKHDFIKKYNLHHSNINDLINGKIKYVKNWYIDKSLIGSNLFNFYHISGKSELNITSFDFANKYNLHKSNISMVINGKRKYVKGWYIDKKLINIKLFNFYHISGKTELNISEHDFIKKHSLSKASVNKVINNKLKSFKGWYLDETLMNSRKLKKASSKKVNKKVKSTWYSEIKQTFLNIFKLKK